MRNKFDVVFLPEAGKFMEGLDKKVLQKIFYNIRMLQVKLDSELLCKLSGEIWELRTEYNGNEYRLMAFWDKRNSINTLVVATHGFIKKTDKVAPREIQKAERIRKRYLE